MNRYLPLVVLASFWIAGCSGSVGSTPAPGPSVSPTVPTPIQHIVVLLQENRSFDNIFAGFPGADTTLVGKCKPAKGAPWCKGDHMIHLHSVLLESTGTPNQGTDIDHSHNGFEVECDANAAHVCQMDGFNLIRFGESGNGPVAKNYPYAYADRTETQPYWDFAKDYTLADKMFFTETASSFIAHQMIISGTVQLAKGEWVTDQPLEPPWGCNSPPGDDAPILHADGKISGSVFPCFKWSTIADLLDAKNVTWCDYVDSGGPHEPFDFSGGVWNGFAAIKKFYHGPDWKTHICSPNTDVFTDVANGTLPSVSLVMPTLYDSDHPASGCNGGPWWVTKVVDAIGESSYWDSTAIIVLWDDWGGWYDNAQPTYVNPSTLGFRVAMLVISPYSRAGTVVHTQYDFGSVIKLMEQTFDLGSLGTTDATARSMEDAFNFSQTPIAFKPEPLPKAMPCKSQVTNPKGMEEVIKHDGGVPE
jgi:phospholipase C